MTPKGNLAPGMYEQNWNSPEFRFSGRAANPRERHTVELEKLIAAWSTVAIGRTDGIITFVTGSIEPVPGTIRDFQIKVLPGYPVAAPQAYSHGWVLSGPHKFNTTQMCLWPPNHWSPRFTLAYAVAKTFTWIHKHEVYAKSGVWPGNEVKH